MRQSSGCCTPLDRAMWTHSNVGIQALRTYWASHFVSQDPVLRRLPFPSLIFKVRWRWLCYLRCCYFVLFHHCFQEVNIDYYHSARVEDFFFLVLFFIILNHSQTYILLGWQVLVVVPSVGLYLPWNLATLYHWPCSSSLLWFSEACDFSHRPSRFPLGYFDGVGMFYVYNPSWDQTLLLCRKPRVDLMCRCFNWVVRLGYASTISHILTFFFFQDKTFFNGVADKLIGLALILDCKSVQPHWGVLAPITLWHFAIRTTKNLFSIGMSNHMTLFLWVGCLSSFFEYETCATVGMVDGASFLLQVLPSWLSSRKMNRNI